MWKSEIRSRPSDKSCRFSTCPTVIFTRLRRSDEWNFEPLWWGCPVLQSPERNVRKSRSIVFGHFVNQVIIWLIWHGIEMTNHNHFMRNDSHNIFFHLCDRCEFPRRSKYHVFILQNVSRNWTLVRKKSGKGQEIASLVTCGNPDLICPCSSFVSCLWNRHLTQVV